MTKRDLTKQFNQLKEEAKTMRSLAEQNIALATRLEAIAASALNELGVVQKVRAQKDKNEYYEKLRAETIARITK